jgi:hypothetical protein
VDREGDEEGRMGQMNKEAGEEEEEFIGASFNKVWSEIVQTIIGFLVHHLTSDI